MGKPKMNIAPDVIKAFVEYEWPGNVRELQNIIEGAVLLSTSKVITLDQVESHLLPFTSNEPESNKYYSSVEEFEKQMIIDALKKHQGNRSETAKALGMSRRTLYRRMKKCGIS
jgi:transcriptional regulator with PAS, ATPase and Fis domain